METRSGRLSEVGRFIRHHGITTLRAAFFLASFMVILERFGVLEGIDALMLRVLPTAFTMPAPSKSSPEMDTTKPIKVFVFTIQQELFETEFKSRSPIERSVLEVYLKELVTVFPSFKVLAIDYDLSPNGYNNDDMKNISQNNLEIFLSNLTEKEDECEDNEKNHHDQKRHVVLINHIPVGNLDLCRKKVEWEKKRYKEGILFGHSDLLHFGALGPVVKYAESQDNFPAIVFAAANDTRLPSMEFNCDYLEPPPHHDTHNKSSHAQPIKPINFLQAVNTGLVKICALHDLNSIKECKNHFREWTDDVKVIFFGGHYGRDDIYMTPLGLKPGVTVHANIYFSMMKPLKPIVHVQAWGIDVILGFIAGLIFHKIWQSFHSCRSSHEAESFVGQVKLIVLNFAFLLGIIAVLMFLMSRMLGRGLWMNPAPMLIGLFIHSYITTAIGATTDNPASTSFGHQLFGLPDPSMTGGDFFLYGLLKIAVFWTTLGIAVGILLTYH